MKSDLEFGMPTLIELGSLEENAALCKELGLSFLELNMNMPEYQVEGLMQTEKLSQASKRYGIYYTIHLDEALNVCDFNRVVAGAYRDTVRRTIAAAKILHVPILNMHMAHGVHFTLPDKKIELFEKYYDRYLEDIKSFRELCVNEIGDDDIKISIENTDGFRKFEQEAIEYLLSSKQFCLTWDIGHSYVAGEVDYDFINNYKNNLAHFHIHDASGDNCHLALGSGELPIKERLMIAKENGCRCVIETKTAASLRESVEWIH